MSLRRILLWLLILVFLGFHLFQMRAAAVEGTIPLYDFIEYWSAVRVFLQGENPYDRAAMLDMQRRVGWTDDDPVMMWNPPWTLIVMMPFGVFPYWTGRAIWFLTGLFSILKVADWVWCWYGGPLHRRWIAWVTALLFIPDLTALFLGQISPLILAGLAGFLYLLDRNRPYLAGSCLVLVALKPHLLYAFWIFLSLRIFRTGGYRIAAGAMGAMASCLVPILLMDPSIFSRYLASVQSAKGPLIWQAPTWGVALRMLISIDANWLQFIPTGMGIVAIVVLWLRWRNEFSWRSRINAIILLSIITSSFTWMFDWVLMLPVAVWLMLRFSLDPVGKRHLLLGLLIIQSLLILQPQIAPSNFFTIWMPPAMALLYWAGGRDPVTAPDLESIVSKEG